ncbi:hypothetical protein [Massilia sp. TS11]|uniref:hypothetical protein n=1 Tax=Massilia sp. TS11 TaxID=2908003 RepID=UPI001EDC4677|nr:hypothetical protein [Massilia sp. TS11]MCG2585512.1 hypothetical protein [Massilia sp. TS11]
MHNIIRIFLVCAVLAGCSPKYNWRDYQDAPTGYRATFPDKPASYTREVDLDGIKVAMSMTAAQVDHVVFAIAWADVPDMAQAQRALTAMQLAMVRNIGGTITSSKAVGSGADIVADGQIKGEATRLQGRFRAQGRRLYQVIVMGPAREIDAEQADTFLAGFVPRERTP